MKIEINAGLDGTAVLIDGYAISPVRGNYFTVNGTLVYGCTKKEVEQVRSDLIAKLEDNSKGKFVTAEDVRKSFEKFVSDEMPYDDCINYVIKELGLE